MEWRTTLEMGPRAGDNRPALNVSPAAWGPAGSAGGFTNPDPAAPDPPFTIPATPEAMSVDVPAGAAYAGVVGTTEVEEGITYYVATYLEPSVTLPTAPRLVVYNPATFANLAEYVHTNPPISGGDGFWTGYALTFTATYTGTVAIRVDTGWLGPPAAMTLYVTPPQVTHPDDAGLFVMHADSADDAAELDTEAGAWVLDGLTMGWSGPEEPAAPEPITARWALLAEDPEALPPLEVGTLCYARVDLYPEDDGPGGWASTSAGTFYGRVTDATAKAVTYQGKAMLEVEVLAASHDAEYGEMYVGQEPWPAEPANVRLDRIVAASGLPQSSQWLEVGAALGNFHALDVDNRSILDLMEDHLRQIADSYFLGAPTVGWFRGVAQPARVGSPPELGILLHAITERNLGTPPRVLVEVDGLAVSMAKDWIGASTDPASERGHLHGTASVSTALCALDLEYRRTKATTINRVVVAGAFDGVDGLGNPNVTEVVAENADEVRLHGPNTRRLDSTLSGSSSAEDMAGIYLPDEAEYQGRWGVRRVVIYAGAMTTATEAGALFTFPPLIPWHGQESGLFDMELFRKGFPFHRLFHVHGLQPGHRLAGDYAAGSIVGASIGVRRHGPKRERLMAEVELVPRVARPEPWDMTPSPPAVGEERDAVALAPQTFKDEWPTLAYKGTALAIDPSLTYYDARLIRHEKGTL